MPIHLSIVGEWWFVAEFAVSTIEKPKTYTRGGGGVSQHFNFAWEISRFNLTAKFPMRNSGCSVIFSHTSSTYSKFPTQNLGGSAKFPTAKLTTANLTWRGIPSPLAKKRKELSGQPSVDDTMDLRALSTVFCRLFFTVYSFFPQFSPVFY